MKPVNNSPFSRTGRGHPVVPEPVPAPPLGRAGGDVVGLLRGRPQLAGELPQRWPALRQGVARHRGVLQALAGVTGAVPGEARAVRVRQDRQGGRAAARRRPGAVPRHSRVRWLLPARQGPGQGCHHARKLLRRPAQQAVRSQERAPGLEDVPGARRRPKRAGVLVDGAREVHTLSEE
jgi:hypothetical protein